MLLFFILGMVIGAVISIGSMLFAEKYIGKVKYPTKSSLRRESWH